MKSITRWVSYCQKLMNKARGADFLAPLALRLYLAPIFLTVGIHKFMHFDDIVSWFEFGLGLPFPTLMAALATAAEIGGGISLLLGLATRWLAVPLMITMLVAAFTAHWDKGWFAVAPTDPQTSIARVLAPIGFPGAEASLQNSAEAGKRLARAKEILREEGDYQWLTETGSFVVLNNGIEFAATYFFMLLSLFFTGAGRFVSCDYWLARKFPARSQSPLCNSVI